MKNKFTKQFMVIFYTKENAPLREIMPTKDPRMDDRVFNKVMRKAKSLGADYFVMAEIVPRRWGCVEKGSEVEG